MLKSLRNALVIATAMSGLAYSGIVQTHGALKTRGNQIVDAAGTPIQLAGMSLSRFSKKAPGDVGFDGRRHGFAGIARPAGCSGGVMAGSFEGASSCYTSALEPSLQRGCFNKKGLIAFEDLRKLSIENVLVISADRPHRGLDLTKVPIPRKGAPGSAFLTKLFILTKLFYADAMTWFPVIAG